MAKRVPRKVAARINAARNAAQDKLEPALADALLKFFRKQARFAAARFNSGRKAFTDPRGLVPASDVKALNDMVLRYETAQWQFTSGAVAPLVDVEVAEVLSRQAQRDLLKRAKNINDVTRDRVSNVIKRGISSRQTDAQIGSEIGKALGSPARGRVIARTELALADQASAHDRYREAGVKAVEIFDGPDCIMPGTKFTGEISGMVRVDYSGPAYTVTAHRGLISYSFTVGPNHPVLTIRGWVKAKHLSESDQLVYDERLQGSATSPESNFNQVPVVEDAFATLCETGKRGVVRRAGNEFHGDAEFSKGEVDVVWAANPLLFVGDGVDVEHARENMFVLPDTDLPFISSGSDSLDLAGEFDPAGCCDVCGGSLCDLPVIIEQAPLPAGVLSGGAGDSVGLGYVIDRFMGDAEHLAYGGATDSGFVKPYDFPVVNFAATKTGTIVGTEPSNRVIDGVKIAATPFADTNGNSAFTFAHISSISISHYEGPVYDATTPHGYFLLDGIVTRNCGWLFHDDGDKANGTVRTMRQSEANPISHPNCVRSSMPVTDVEVPDTSAELAQWQGDQQQQWIAEGLI